MVKKLLSNFALLLTMMVAGAGAAWGAEVTYTISSHNTLTTSGTAPEGSSATIVETYGTSCQMTKTNSQTLKLSGYEGCKITKIVLSMKSNKSSGAGCFGYSTDAGAEYTWLVGEYSKSGSTGLTFSNAAWHGSWSSSYVDVTKNVNITCGSDDVWFFLYATTNSLFCQSYTITYEQETASLANAEFSFGEVTSFTANINGDFEAPTLTTAEGYDGTITYSSSDEEIAVVDESTGEVVIGEKVGTVTITASAEATDNFKAGEASYTIKVIDPNANDGLSEEKAFTVAEAIAAISNGNYVASTTYFVKGIISQIDGFNSTYGSITYWISDDGTTTNQFECYSGKNIGGAEFESVEDLSTGDQVVVKGKLKKYGDIYEFDKNNEIVSRIGDQRIDIATINSISIETVAPGESGTITYDIDFAEGTAEDDYEVTLSSSDNNLLLLDGFDYVAGDEEGEVTITVNVEPLDDATYKAVSKTFTVNIVDPNRKGTEANPYTVAEVIDGTATGSGVYVKGFIVGCYKDNNFSNTDQSVNSNLALADNANETDATNIIPVELPSGDRRTELNVQDHFWNVGVAQILYKGNVQRYFGMNGVKGAQAGTKKVAEQVNISNAGMATYYTDCALDLTAFTDMYAYTATVSGSTITFSRVMQVPANTGVLLRNPAEAAASNVVPVATGTVAAVQGNKFVGTLTDITVSDADCYILNNSTTNGLGFYKVKSTGSNVAAHRAYLKTGTDGARSFIGFSEGEANGIESIGAEAARSMEVYNLQGVRVAQPTKGLYIMNGKKVIFK